MLEMCCSDPTHDNTHCVVVVELQVKCSRIHRHGLTAAGGGHHLVSVVDVLGNKAA